MVPPESVYIAPSAICDSFPERDAALSAGHGLNLQDGGNTLVWFGLTWSLELYQQTVARLWRQGQARCDFAVRQLQDEVFLQIRIPRILLLREIHRSRNGSKN